MKNPPALEKILCLLVILAALAILALMSISPSIFLEAGSVYQGF